MFSIIKYITTFVCILILSNGCRQPVIPTEEDLAGYGWTLYEQGEYQAVSYTHLTLPTIYSV